MKRGRAGLNSGETVILDLDGLEDPEGLPGNGNWLYGTKDGGLVRVRPNGSELSEIYRPEEGLAVSEIIHATEHFVFFVREEEENRSICRFELLTGRCDRIKEDITEK